MPLEPSDEVISTRVASLTPAPGRSFTMGGASSLSPVGSSVKTLSFCAAIITVRPDLL